MTTYTPPIDELRQIVNGPCPQTLRDEVQAALAPVCPPKTTPAAIGDATRRARHHRDLLCRLAHALPPAEQLCRSPQSLAALSECLAVADPPSCMAALSHYALCLNSIVSLSDDPEQLGSRWKELSSGRTNGVFLVTEIGDGSSHLSMRTTAEFDPETYGFVLSTPDAGAAKVSGVGAPGIAQSAVVCARLRVAGSDHGIFSFVVDLATAQGPAPGVQISSPIEAADLPLDYALVSFTNVRLAYGQWLNDGAAIDAQGRFHDPLPTPDARLARTLCVGQALWATLPSAMAAMARNSAVRAVRHSAHRRTHGRLSPGSPVLAYRSQQHAVLGCLAEAFALTCAGHAAQGIWARSLRQHGWQHRGGNHTTVMAFSPWAAVDRPLAVLKAHAVRAAARVTAQCQHRCGLAGFLNTNRLTAYHGLAHSFDSAGGDSQLILLDAGRAIAEKAGAPEAFTTPPQAPVGHPYWWPAIARIHENTLANQLRATLKKRTLSGLRGPELWNPLLDAARELGEAYADRLAAESLASTLATVKDPALHTALDVLAALYGTAQARRVSGRLLTSAVLDTDTARALPQVMDALCDRLLPHLPLLEEAMATPQNTPSGAADDATAPSGSVRWPTEGQP